ncbi:MAG: hypothetical protein H0A75_05565 [Candidatus Methanofishera endochildressiae]|uniref:Uncharacterized protein n=1 Tax=Candidatus Methanofishera endochildressiae TaxID=2738884 RepID=A0A7Z0MNY0_9GAMM|nr:hypothetical protein [Candidatus Methanofishera endochildressiae]
MLPPPALKIRETERGKDDFSPDRRHPGQRRGCAEGQKVTNTRPAIWGDDDKAVFVRSR